MQQILLSFIFDIERFWLKKKWFLTFPAPVVSLLCSLDTTENMKMKLWETRSWVVELTYKNREKEKKIAHFFEGMGDNPHKETAFRF